MTAPHPPIRRAPPRGTRCALAALAFLASPAAAIVGGSEGGDLPGGRSAVMVLTAGGGVCTGIVVAPDAVLTAGHCVAGIAQNRVHYRDEAGQPVLAEVASRQLHPAYDGDAIRGRTRSIDLALLRTRAALPARFEPAALSPAMPRAGAALTLAGYGAARGNDRRSIGRYRGATLSVVEPYGPSRILLWLQAPRAGGCNGDSGGPVLDGGAVVAVAAWVKDACGGLTQAILLGPQRDWIDRTLAAWGASARW
ncbi:hypothetical protein HNR00_000703 [Methylorubrum rhodinum]|uniref:Peptidase S1 domain-containing protein n=1 Tax=Methylorubrum rhodinum TaxID=29428 RepID=A0A840ZG98_9HYPH|nr:trypsin-like serine protease [Methylorubrum rhodinum]MBB5756007.1 hypothetical protein [Methylorubrum rhodinum]